MDGVVRGQSQRRCSGLLANIVRESHTEYANFIKCKIMKRPFWSLVSAVTYRIVIDLKKNFTLQKIIIRFVFA